MARPKKITRELATLDDANRAIRGLLIEQVELEKIQGQLDLARAQATARFEADIDASKSHIADLTAQLEHWYHVHAQPLAGRKSVQLAYGVIGERTGQPQLKPINRSWTWRAIAAKLQSIYGARFFHAPKEPEPDKDLLRAELSAEQLKVCGLMVEQAERFYVDLDRSALGDAA